MTSKDLRVVKSAVETLSGDELIEALLEPAQEQYYLLGRADEALHATFALLTRGQKMLSATIWLEDQVDNGGFEQYFYNTDGDFAADALEGLRLIGANRLAEILAEAMVQFPNGAPSRDRAVRQTQLAHLSDADKAKLDELDLAFYQGNEGDELTSLQLSYIHQHPEEFSK